MSGRHVIVGVDDRIDEYGQSQPWRIVMMGAAIDGGSVQYLMSLPDDRRYLSQPRHALYGDLTRLGETAKQQIVRIAEQLRTMDVMEIHIDERHRNGDFGRTMIWNGIEPRGHEVPSEEMMDPFSIGGEAGHQIAHIENRLRNTA